MLILFANQKGGSGKSTLALLFANYLALVKNKKVEVIDMDFQQSIYNKSQAAANLANPPLYEVVASELSGFKKLYQPSNGDDKITICDLPGKIDDDNLVPIFQQSDLVLCPFSYDEFSVSSTIEFAFVLKAIRKNVRIFFLPNRVKATVKYITQKSVKEALNNFGQVTQPITDRIDFQRINTYETPASIIQVVYPLFEYIFNETIDNVMHG
jgi:chromosome partitioning protein